MKTRIVLPVFRRQAPTTAGAVLLGKTQLQLDRPLIPRPYRNFHSFQTGRLPLLEAAPRKSRIRTGIGYVPSGSCEEIDECTRTVIVTYVFTLYSANMNTLPDPPRPRPRLSSIDRSQLVFRTVDVERMIDDDHSARSIWETIGGLNLSLYDAKTAAVEGRAGRDHTAPQLLISLWLYAYSRGISSAREIARRCEFEPAFQWLCGLQPVSHRTLSGFRSDNKDALGSVFVQVVGVLSAEGLITMERVTLDGTKIKANASGNTFDARRRSKPIWLRRKHN